MRQYEPWWAALPAPAGLRPVEITTTVRNIAVEVTVGRVEGLPVKSAANCDNLRTVARSALVERIGRLAPGRHSEVKRAVGYALSWEELMEAE